MWCWIHMPTTHWMQISQQGLHMQLHEWLHNGGQLSSWHSHIRNVYIISAHNYLPTIYTKFIIYNKLLVQYFNFGVNLVAFIVYKFQCNICTTEFTTWTNKFSKSEQMVSTNNNWNYYVFCSSYINHYCSLLVQEAQKVIEDSKICSKFSYCIKFIFIVI